MSAKKSSRKGGSGKKTGSAKKKAATTSAGRKSSRMTPGSRGRAGERSSSSTSRRGAQSSRQSPKDTGPGADPRGAEKGTPAAEGFDQAHGRYRDEVVDVPEKSEFIVRRTFLASKTEFEVEVPKAGLGKSVVELNKLPRGEREQLVKDAAKVALDLRTKQLSTELDNSEFGGKSIAGPVGGGTVNPENRFAPRGQSGASPDLVDRTGTLGDEDEAAAGRKGEGAATTSTGAPATDAAIRGTPNDRTDTAGSSKSAETTGAPAS